MKKFPFFLPFGGCTGRCVYCSQKTITGQEFVPSPEYVRQELSKLAEPREVCFFGGSFCRFPLPLVKAYLDAVRSFAPAGSKIRFSTYPGDLDDENVREAVKASPIACAELGIQSLDPAVLSVCKREADPQKILESIAMMAREKIPIGVQLMIGLPGQTKESSLRDIEALSEIKGSASWDLRIYPCLVIAGTELEEMMNDGSFVPLSLEDAVSWGGELLDRAVSLGFNPIRVGLQETELLASAVRGGPHHPALGELIMSDALARKFARLGKSEWIAAKNDISKFTGHSGFGYKKLAEYSGISVEEAKKRLSFSQN